MSTPTRRPCSARSPPTPSRTATTSASPTRSGSTAPRGWEVLRLAPDPDLLGPSIDDLEALADAVREAANVSRAPDGGPEQMPVGAGRRGHLRVLRDTDCLPTLIDV